MIIPSDAKVIGTNQKLKCPFLVYVAVFFLLLSIIAMFCIVVSLDLDIEYNDIDPSLGKFLIFLTILIGTIIVIVSALVIYRALTRKKRSQYTEVLIDEFYLYFKGKNNNDSKAIPLKNIIGFDDNKQYTQIYYSLGVKKGVKAEYQEISGLLEIRYREDYKNKTIKTYLEDPRATRDKISNVLRTLKGDENDHLRVVGTKLKNLSYGLKVMGYVVLFGTIFVAALLLKLNIEDVTKYDIYVPDIAFVFDGILFVAGVPLFIMVQITFSIYRHQPEAVILYDKATRTYYFYDRYKYIAVLDKDIISSKTRNNAISVPTGTVFTMKDFFAGTHKQVREYKYAQSSEGKVKIKYKKNNRVHKYFVYVKNVDETDV